MIDVTTFQKDSCIFYRLLNPLDKKTNVRCLYRVANESNVAWLHSFRQKKYYSGQCLYYTKRIYEISKKSYLCYMATHAIHVCFVLCRCYSTGVGAFAEQLILKY